jgi:hypothetical protein
VVHFYRTALITIPREKAKLVAPGLKIEDVVAKLKEWKLLEVAKKKK